MITDPRVFENGYLPRELMHREGEVEELTRAFQPALHGQAADHVLISGPSGVGKTVLARFALERLLEHRFVDWAHIRCLGTTAGGLLRSALREHQTSVDVAQNTPVDRLRQQLRDIVDDPYIIVLDEADGLRSAEAIEQLAGLPKISIIPICHKPEKWLARAPSAVRNGLRRHIELGRYGIDELADILQARVDEGLPPNAISRQQLRSIANGVAGVARFGIQSLRAAAEIADERGHSEILDDDIADSFDRARRWIRESNLDSLPFHHHVIYSLIREAGEISAAELHDRYEELAESLYFDRDLTPIGCRSRRNKLAKLQEYGLIDYEGPHQHRFYYVLDEAISSPVEIPSVNQQRAE
jgi:Cdc6-like AAA superfamily ATPase